MNDNDVEYNVIRSDDSEPYALPDNLMYISSLRRLLEQFNARGARTVNGDLQLLVPDEEAQYLVWVDITELELVPTFQH